MKIKSLCKIVRSSVFLLLPLFAVLVCFPFICEGRHFTLRGKTLTCLHHRVGLWPYIYFNPATFYRSVCARARKWTVVYIPFGVSVFSLSGIFLFDFGNVPTVRYFLFFI